MKISLHRAAAESEGRLDKPVFGELMCPRCRACPGTTGEDCVVVDLKSIARRYAYMFFDQFLYIAARCFAAGICIFGDVLFNVLCFVVSAVGFFGLCISLRYC